MKVTAVLAVLALCIGVALCGQTYRKNVYGMSHCENSSCLDTITIEPTFLIHNAFVRVLIVGDYFGLDFIGLIAANGVQIALWYPQEFLRTCIYLNGPPSGWITFLDESNVPSSTCYEQEQRPSDLINPNVSGLVSTVNGGLWSIFVGTFATYETALLGWEITFNYNLGFTGGDPYVHGFADVPFKLEAAIGDHVNLLSTPHFQVNSRIGQAPLRSKRQYFDQLAVSIKGVDYHLFMDTASSAEQNYASPVVAIVNNAGDVVDRLIPGRARSLDVEGSTCIITRYDNHNEQFNDIEVVETDVTQSPIIRVVMECNDHSFVAEMHEIKHVVKLIDGEFHLKYEHEPELTVEGSSFQNYWVERRIDFHVLDAEKSSVMDGILGQTHPRSARGMEIHRDIEQFRIPSARILGTDYKFNHFA